MISFENSEEVAIEKRKIKVGKEPYLNIASMQMISALKNL